MARVMPPGTTETKVEAIGPGVLSLEDMDPDFDGDGTVSPLEKAVYAQMRAADADGDGFLTRREVYEVIAGMKKELDEAGKGGIPIATLNPVRAEPPSNSRTARRRPRCCALLACTKVPLPPPPPLARRHRIPTATGRSRRGRRTSLGAFRRPTPTRAARSA